MKFVGAKNGYCIFIDTLCQGVVPAYYGANDFPLVFSTEREAQEEVVHNATKKLEQFLRSERDFYDAITIEEFIAPVTQYPDGVVTDEQGGIFGRCE